MEDPLTHLNNISVQGEQHSTPRREISLVNHSRLDEKTLVSEGYATGGEKYNFRSTGK